MPGGSSARAAARLYSCLPWRVLVGRALRASRSGRQVPARLARSARPTASRHGCASRKLPPNNLRASFLRPIRVCADDPPLPPDVARTGPEKFFQSFEKLAEFSNHWKKVFQSLENFSGSRELPDGAKPGVGKRLFPSRPAAANTERAEEGGTEGAGRELRACGSASLFLLAVAGVGGASSPSEPFRASGASAARTECSPHRHQARGGTDAPPINPSAKNSPCILSPSPPSLRRRLSRRPFPKENHPCRPVRRRRVPRFFGLRGGRGRMYKHARRPGAPVARPVGGALYGEKLV